MLTGLWPHTAGVPSCNVPLAAEVPTIAEMLPADYRTAFMGKWHLGDKIFPQHGFETWVGTEDSYRHSFSERERLSVVSPYHHFLVAKGFEPDAENQGQGIFSRHLEASMAEEFTKATFLGDQAARFIRDSGDEPFALCVSYLEPHPPHTGPLNEHYDPAELPVSPSFRELPPANAPLMVRLMAAFYSASENYGLDLQTEAGWRALMARYWGNVTLVDRSVAKILQALQASGKADDTIVVFTSDHGELMGDHGILGKTLMYEESIRVPLLIRVPALDRRHRRINGNFSHIDLVATMLELMGLPAPKGVQGISRAPVLRGERTLEHEDVFLEWSGSDGHTGASLGEAEVNKSLGEPLRSVITAERWKLNVYERGQHELYDLNADPHELTNLYGQPEQRNRIDDLTAGLRRWQHQTGDEIDLPL